MEDKSLMRPLPIVLDTDIGNDPDDLLALAMVLDRTDLFELRGIVTTGKEPALRARFASCLCCVAGRSDIPVAIGCDTPLSHSPSDFHLRFFSARGLPEHVAELISWEELMAQLTPDVTVVTIGPLTTLATWLREFPGGTSRLGKVVSMGGFVTRRKRKPVGEYNFGIDAEATRIVLRLSSRHICVTKNVCNGARMVPTDLDRLPMGETTAARSWAFDFMRVWFAKRDCKVLYDPLTLATALLPEYMDLQPVEFDMSDDSPIARMSARILASGNRLATVGRTPTDLTWFEEILYGCSQSPSCAPEQTHCGSGE
ncbi:MAG: hypothetical protein HN742_06145 [Lentisphaerae bacterium]|jgi:inosine-uridine nucleoside N-ribohydrolase|nr:hypothetical protein [Lentisphaerota bacterium]MBT4820016.1 hypothetical protein [Lentisphaerota bacterium]MBT5612087.1 hypothetical protein [Lentisphaerota bacterium]MBT7060935.1 hypothetical protein [Lentisphaerota bacterium]MBT7841431.1 hypothetical protein [Lentisphaerota bacterium]